ncbi:ionotropic receptor 21a-like [Penaeus chinensis]|uniref:ionotropic receptor 21a-like n=1 Tax=Penaeus chinensis TaxID=139456 RepID=UPI001FB7356E|nr:ionotropic receptor 21a-like [Penaeus chinensis]
MFHTTAEEDKDLLSEAAGVVTDLVKASSRAQASLVLLTDGTSSSSSVSKVLNGVESTWGVGVFEVKKIQRRSGNVSEAHFASVVAQARQIRTASRNVFVIVVSDDPTFLSTFAESSRKGRLLNWTTRLLVVTRMTLQELRDLVASYWTFSKMNVVVLNSEGNRRRGRRYSLYSYLPYQPGGPQMVKVGTWTANLSLRLRGSLFQEKYSNFYGAQVNVTAQTYIPKWKEKVVKLPDGSEVTRYSGSDYLALTVIADALNFSLNIIPTASFDKATAKLEEGVLFLVAIGFSILPGRLKRYDFTRPFDTYKTSFAMANPKPQPSWYSLVYPLSYEVWLSIGVALAGTSLVLRLLTHYAEGDQYPGLGPIAQVVYKILLGQDLVQRFVRAPSTRLMISCWLAFSLIIGVAYRSNLTTSLTLPKEPPRIETIRELVERVDRVLLPFYGKDWVSFYLNSESEIYRHLGEILHLGSAVEEEMAKLEHNHAAFIESHLLLNYIIAKDYTDATGRGKLYVGKSYFLTTFSAWPIPHDAPYKQQLDKCLLAFTEVRWAG